VEERRWRRREMGRRKRGVRIYLGRKKCDLTGVIGGGVK